jgi:hypothetical protein
MEKTVLGRSESDRVCETVFQVSRDDFQILFPLRSTMNPYRQLAKEFEYFVCRSMGEMDNRSETKSQELPM